MRKETKIIICFALEIICMALVPIATYLGNEYIALISLGFAILFKLSGLEVKINDLTK